MYAKPYGDQAPGHGQEARKDQEGAQRKAGFGPCMQGTKAVQLCEPDQQVVEPRDLAQHVLPHDATVGNLSLSLSFGAPRLKPFDHALRLSIGEGSIDVIAAFQKQQDGREDPKCDQTGQHSYTLLASKMS